MAKLTITIDTDELSVVLPGTNQVIGCCINAGLVRRQHCTDNDVAMLLMTHAIRSYLFDSMEQIDIDTNIEILKRYDRVYAHLQRCQQELWGFEQNDNFLRPWDVPKCECPNMDNDDNWGTPYRITSAACKLHWNNEQGTKDESE